MSEIRPIEVYNSQQNSTEVLGGPNMPFQLALPLTGLFITLALMTTISIRIERINSVRNALDKKLARIQERLIYIQGNYSKRVNNRIYDYDYDYDYHDPEIENNLYLTDIDDVTKRTELKPSFINFSKTLKKTLGAEHELKFRKTRLSDDPDKTFNYYKKVGRYTDNGLNYNIGLELILSGNTVNWVFTLIKDKNSRTQEITTE